MVYLNKLFIFPLKILKHYLASNYSSRKNYNVKYIAYSKDP